MTIVQRNAPPRAVWALEQAGVHPLLARLYAARGVQHPTELDDHLGHLAPPDTMTGTAEAAALLAEALRTGQRICVVADYDGDGLTPPIAQRVHALGADVLLTVDNGIASVDGVAHARSLGLEVLVTDHHLPAVVDGHPVLPQGCVTVNPNQPGCGFTSKAIAGVGVVFYVLLALRTLLREQGVFGRDNQPRIDTLLPLVALGTVADVVRLDANNRRLVAQGLKRIRAGAVPPGLQALFQAAGRQAARAGAGDLAYALGPRINAAGRLSDMTLGIECLTTDDPARALELARQLDAINRERREIEAGMRELAEV